jgi:hypothetical protein
MEIILHCGGNPDKLNDLFNPWKVPYSLGYKLRTTGELLQQKTKAKVVFSWVLAVFRLVISTKILPTRTEIGKEKVCFYTNFAKIYSISAVFRLWRNPKASVR